MTKDELERIISVTVTTTPSGEDIMKPLVLAGYQAALVAVNTEMERLAKEASISCNDFDVNRLDDWLTQALAEGRKG